MKVAVVTGASSGIGAAAVHRLLSDDWGVVGLSRRDPKLRHDQFNWVTADLADLEQLQNRLSEVGEVDAIVHAAGLQRAAALGALKVEDGMDMWRVHVGAA